MKSILPDLSGKIEPSHVEVLSLIRDTAGPLQIPFFVVGATARDYILKHGYNIETIRMTQDVDIGVKVEDWSQYDKLTSALLSTGKFVQEKITHRFFAEKVMVDIIPFGGLADKEKMIRWPPDQEVIMSVLGFQEAFDHSITLRLNADPLLEIKVPTLAGLALIKLIAWDDAYPTRQKDAEDLLFIVNKYENTVDLFDTEPVLMQEEAFDARLAGIRLLGRDMAHVADPETRTAVQSVLDRETMEQSQYRLIADMLKDRLKTENSFEGILRQVEKLKQGFLDIAGKRD